MPILKLKNFKSIDNLEFNLKNLNILTGLNSSGKSSIIQSMRMLHNASIKKDIYFDEIYGGFNELVCEFFQDDKEISIELTGYGSIKVKENGFDNNITNELQVIYIGANRVGPLRYAINAVNPDKYNPLGIDGEYCYQYIIQNDSANYSKFLEYSNFENNKTNETIALKHLIEDWIKKIAHVQSFNINQGSNGMEDITTMQINKKYKATNVGYGIGYVLPVITALIAFSGKEDTFILLENPEAHIHPKGQSALGELIAKVASTGTKIILETHSDHIISGIRLATKYNLINHEDICVNFFKIVEKNTSVYVTENTIINIDKDGRFDKYPEDFFDQFELNLERLL